MTSAKEFQESFGKRKPSAEQVAELHRLREQDVRAIAAKPVITVADIQTLEWGGRFAIANKYLDKCDEQAREALLRDAHHGVRSAAVLFKPRAQAARTQPELRGGSAVPASVTEIAQAILNGRSNLETQYGAKSASDIEQMILSTHPKAALEGAEAFIGGFEGDELQEGVDDLLRQLRAAIAPLR